MGRQKRLKFWSLVEKPDENVTLFEPTSFHGPGVVNLHLLNDFCVLCCAMLRSAVLCCANLQRLPNFFPAIPLVLNSLVSSTSTPCNDICLLVVGFDVQDQDRTSAGFPTCLYTRWKGSNLFFFFLILGPLPFFSNSSPCCHTRLCLLPTHAGAVPVLCITAGYWILLQYDKGRVHR
ncbi:uncharacterized protein LALA0_S03e00606g [Lachancea lanzarotensis]|uniref:LALA0S03e00606g1_1 n=1 Tax=Lachancea lanzarotensis TaxID=1245769 RepID=A0A0C7MN85_9SACH|nr:uncharacterized protein LALA0_S03e00606g [Lachancea lanzarotensis]CEP61337.1 LALA0S03e00606g1_1 [Lachancea lanzarotensis]